MKKIIFIKILFLTLMFSCSSEHQWEGNFSFLPERPEPGDEITVYYNSDNTKLALSENVEMVAYTYSIGLDETVGIEMKKIKNGWKGKVQTTEKTKGVVVKFINQEIVDNNEKNGYVIHLYKGDEIIPGSYAGLGGAHLNWGSYYVDLERDFNLSLELMNKDFENNPDIKEEYLSSYLLLLSQLFPDKVNEIAKTELQEIEKKNNLEEKDLSVLVEWYGKLDQEKSESYYKILIEKYPQNERVQIKRYQEVQNENDIVKKKELADKFYKDFPDSRYSQTVYDLVAIYYRDNNRFNEMLDFFKDNSNKTSIFRFYSVNQRIFKENGDPDIALQIAKLGVERSEKELINPSKKKPDFLTEKEWKEETEFYTGLNYFSYGKALFLTGNKKEAETNLEKAAGLTKNKDGEVNEMFVTSVFENGNNAKTKEIIENYIKDGKSTSSMMDILKEIFISGNNSAEEFENYLSKFKSLALEDLKNKLKNEMINKAAPNFTLEDFNGNKISLADLKGKTVIVDFWATWCGPCLQSFPGMQKAVEKYNDNDNVKFLFVNSWERVEDKKKNAQEFIKKNNYPFLVLMDYDNEVIKDFGVAGIPTKFIIDKNSDIRFMSVGFSGNTDHLVDEISVMIDLVN